MMFDLDSLIAEAELESGVDPAIVGSRHPGAQVSGVIETGRVNPAKSFRWSLSDLRWLDENLPVLNTNELATRLGRTENAIKIVQVRRGIIVKSKRPGWVTAHQAAALLGIDVHAICFLTDTGRLPSRVLPGGRRIRMIRYVTLLRWAVNPENWLYFFNSMRDTARILDPHLRRLIERQKARWGDEWWTIGEVAAYHGVEHFDVNRAIRRGEIKAVKWSNWKILRSEATRPEVRFLKGKGAARSVLFDERWSKEADAFLLDCRRQWVRWAVIAKKMKMKQANVQYRYYCLVKRGETTSLV
jgi:hypothetical protein